MNGRPAGSDDLFSTETAGLPDVSRPKVIRLGDGDRLDGVVQVRDAAGRLSKFFETVYEG
jgi:hypothetical protein